MTRPVAIVPAAGVGTRLRPHTHTIPKALINVAGSPILAHILDGLVAEGIERVVVVVGYMGDRIRAYVSSVTASPSSSSSRRNGSVSVTPYSSRARPSRKVPS